MQVRVKSEVPLSRRERRRVGRIARGVLSRLERGKEVELSLLLVGEDRMAELNERYLGATGPTDVLAFPQEEPPVWIGRQSAHGRDLILGDVVICLSVAERQAVMSGASLEEELEALVAHGLLHLLGYDDTSVEGRREMARAEGRLLGRSIIEA